MIAVAERARLLALDRRRKPKLHEPTIPADVYREALFDLLRFYDRGSVAGWNAAEVARLYEIRALARI